MYYRNKTYIARQFKDFHGFHGVKINVATEQIKQHQLLQWRGHKNY